jgi:RTX calcium-binding nonapeptide repeat (4 copies)
MKLNSRVLAITGAIAALACAPAAAQAGTVSVESFRVPGPANQSVVHFTAAPGETNAVTIVAADPEAKPKPGTPTVVIVRDTGAPLSAGADCTPVDANTASCKLHPWEEGQTVNCGHDCWQPVPETVWTDAERVELGDANDSFSSSIGGPIAQAWAIELDAGSGADTIATGPGADQITPGPGDDTISPGEGGNRVIADPRPDGNDTINVASTSSVLVDDSARTEPLHLDGHVLGAAGEADTINVTTPSVIEVRGGSADDEFTSFGERLDGGPGNDKLTGSPGEDHIYGGLGDDTIEGGAGRDWLYGGGGDDLVDGGAGDDVIEEREELRPDGKGGGTSTGNDTIDGGEGDDYILAGYGGDTIEGGPGDDRIYGEPGDDTIQGGAGDDVVSGDEGNDTIRGGEGDDRLVAAYNFGGVRGVRSGVDTGVDSLDCGPGEDVSVVNPWDSALDCERRVTSHAVIVRHISRDRAKGTAAIYYTAWATAGAKFTVGGKGVRPVTITPPDPLAKNSKGKFLVRATGAALRTLRRTGGVNLIATITWRPAEKPSATETLRVNLRLKRPARR